MMPGSVFISKRFLEARAAFCSFSNRAQYTCIQLVLNTFAELRFSSPRKVFKKLCLAVESNGGGME